MKTEIKDSKRNSGIITHGVGNYFGKSAKSIFVKPGSYLRKKSTSANNFCVGSYFYISRLCGHSHVSPKEWDIHSRHIEEVNEIDIEKLLYEANKELYLKHYEGKYIALQNEVVLDSDSEFSKIAERVYSKYGYKPIFMPFVTKDESRLKLRSPKFK